MRAEDIFGEVRSLLHGPEGDAASWEALCRLVEAIDGERLQAQLLPYLRPQLGRWPPHLRVAPRRWLTQPGFSAPLSLCQGAILDAQGVAATTRVMRQDPTLRWPARLILRLPHEQEPHELMRDALAHVLPEAQALTTVRELFVLPGRWTSRTALRALLGGGALRQLERLVLRGQPRQPWLGQALASAHALRELDLSLGAMASLAAVPKTVERLTLEHMTPAPDALPAWLSGRTSALRELTLSPGEQPERWPEAAIEGLRGLERLSAPAPVVEALLSRRAALDVLAPTLRSLEVRAQLGLTSKVRLKGLEQLAHLEQLTLQVHVERAWLLKTLPALTRLDHLRLRGAWSAALVRALQDAGLAAQLRVVGIEQADAQALRALALMQPERWPTLRALHVQLGPVLARVDQWPCLALVEELSLRSAQPEAAATLMGLRQALDGEPSLLRQRLRALTLGALRGSADDDLDSPLFEAPLPRLRLLDLSEDLESGDLAARRLVTQALGLRQLRFLALRMSRLDAPDFLASLAKSPTLDALECVDLGALAPSLAAALHGGARAEWASVSRMMYWYYHRHPQALGLLSMASA